MHLAGSLLPCTTPSTAAAASIITSTRTNSLSFHGNISTSSRKSHKHFNNNDSPVACKASSRSASSAAFSSLKDLDLYELLGLERGSDQNQIKMAYRKLQKRCHPDIAGPSGHEMAIILNQVYAILSDPYTRLLYDKEQAKVLDIRGYTGKPIYSVWLGSENEERAVFVDEVKCVGCLKCALLADNTFAIESVYGRARVVAQWADPETQIQEAIQACPVDCISVVERSNLAALEFLMSKQPRGKVRIGVGNTVGERTPDVFNELDRFLARFQDTRSKDSTEYSMVSESDSQRQARNAAIQTIRSMSNWLYWQSPIPGGHSPHSLTRTTQKPVEDDIRKLQEAVAARNRAMKNPKLISQISSNNYLDKDEYWTPLSQEDLSTTHFFSTPQIAVPTKEEEGKPKARRRVFAPQRRIKRDPRLWGIPLATSLSGAIVVHFLVPYEVTTLEDHVGGPMLLGIVNSSWQHDFLAAIAWFLVGLVILQLVEAIHYGLGKNKS